MFKFDLRVLMKAPYHLAFISNINFSGLIIFPGLALIVALVWGTIVLWRKLLKSNRLHRLIKWLLITFSSLISLFVLYVMVIAMWILNTAYYYPKSNFDHAKWTSDHETRYEMSDDIIDSKILIGKTKKQVIAILGLEYNKLDNNEWYYRLGIKPEIANIDQDDLEVVFKDGFVVEVRQFTE